VSAVPTIQSWEREVLDFLTSHAEATDPQALKWGEGSDRVALIPDSDRDDPSIVQEEQAWRALAFDAGLAWPDGPVELGGRGFTVEHRYVYDRLEARFDVPSPKHLGIGVRMVAPSIQAWAQPAVREVLPRALQRGELIGCQLFSEPSAGSDLASLRTSARRDGDEWVIRGQKVWSSEAHWADVGLLLARSSTAGSKHEGITAFVLRLDAPGVEVRAIRQMTGGSSFNAVFLDDVRVPDGHRLGEVGQGWRVAMSALSGERGSIGGGVGLETISPRRLLDLANAVGRASDPLIRQRIADVAIRARSVETAQSMLLDAGSPDAPIGPEMSAAKLLATDVLCRAQELLAALLGPRLTANSGEWGTFAWAEWVLGVPGVRFGGGTDEIQRNIVADRVLGLPRE
jgi:alkylation response protein AidB-like acyl-CoA dehydrogenase